MWEKKAIKKVIKHTDASAWSYNIQGARVNKASWLDQRLLYLKDKHFEVNNWIL